MKKAKKSPTILYGIEITKPFSKAMYGHNEMVAKVMKFNIKDAWHNEAIKFNGDDDWPTQSKIDKIIDVQSAVMAVGYGDGYTINEVERDFYSELENMADWQLHENYSYMCFKGLVPRTHFMMVGFDWEKCDYAYSYSHSELSPLSTLSC